MIIDLVKHLSFNNFVIEIRQIFDYRYHTIQRLGIETYYLCFH